MESKEMSKSEEQLIDKEIYIPIELLRDEILARLPVKTLLKSRCVCKLWCTLIDSQDFRLNPKSCKSPYILYIDLEFHRWASNQCTLTLRSIDTFETIDDSDLCKMYGRLRFYGSGNGLMLMYHHDMNILRVWNPCIRKSLLLPPCPFKIDRRFQLETYMLGYRSSDGDNNFKVAAFKCHPGKPFYGGRYVSIAVYSSQSHSWSSAINRNDVRLCPPGPTGRVFYQGAWYWITKTHLVSFDFNSEDFSYVELPVDVMQGKFTRFIFLLCESLAILSVSSKCFCVWVLNKDSQKKPSWRPWLSRDSTINEDLLDEIRYLELSRIFYNNEDIDTFIFQGTKKVFSYTFSTQQEQILMRPPRNNEITLDAYEESLVLHKGFDGQILSSYPSHDNETDLDAVAWRFWEDYEKRRSEAIYKFFYDERITFYLERKKMVFEVFNEMLKTIRESSRRSPELASNVVRDEEHYEKMLAELH